MAAKIMRSDPGGPPSSLITHFLAALTLLLLYHAPPAAAGADLYSYETPEGILVFTDDPAAPQKSATVRRHATSSPSPAAAPPNFAPLPARATPHPREGAHRVVRQSFSYDIGGRTFPEIRREIYRRSPGPRKGDLAAIGWCSWNVSWTIHTRQQEGRCRIEAVDTVANIAVTMPSWGNYPAADSGMKAAWDQYYGAVLAHEEIHAGHGVEAALQIQRFLPELPGTATCRGITEEANLLAGRIVRNHREKDLELDRNEGTDYDTITDVVRAADKREGVEGRQYPVRKNPVLR